MHIQCGIEQLIICGLLVNFNHLLQLSRDKPFQSHCPIWGLDWQDVCLLKKYLPVFAISMHPMVYICAKNAFIWVPHMLGYPIDALSVVMYTSLAYPSLSVLWYVQYGVEQLIYSFVVVNEPQVDNYLQLHTFKRQTSPVQSQHYYNVVQTHCYNVGN
jgi:hypothetical protein